MHSLARALYSAALWLAQSLLRAKLQRRAAAEPLYGMHMQERFGYYGAAQATLQVSAHPQGWVWVHAVSLGETRAAAVLVAQLRLLMPSMRLLLTHSTATGRAEGAKLLQAGDQQAWLPWDTQAATRRFMAHFAPCIGIVMETEVWPNLCSAAQRAGVPMVLANARLNASSLRKAQRLALLARPAYASFAQVLAQTEADAQRLAAAGAQHVSVHGNLKFDAAPSPALLQQGRTWRPTRPVVLLASSREGEEALFLEQIMAMAQGNSAQAAIHSGVGAAPLGTPPTAAALANQAVQWLIVPRHPQRFAEVASLITQAGFSVSRRSNWASGPPASGPPNCIWLGDSLGEMALYYAMSDCALLGGSFAPFGGQNLIEAIAADCPIVIGPHTFNFADAASTAIAQGAALRAASMPQAVQCALQITADAPQRQALQQAAAQWLAHSSGAALRMAQAVVQVVVQLKRD
jgi:3-deoxy-D-manno-octulosonic-acid transferase